MLGLRSRLVSKTHKGKKNKSYKADSYKAQKRIRESEKSC